jgi:hypothetical protein
MARTNKVGIDYFPFDVDFFNDEKIEFVSARFGVKGEVIAIRLLCKIYRKGYYTDWNEDESTLLAKRAGDGITPSLVSEIVKELVKRGFFDKTLFDRFKILSSKGIQKRYFEITSRYKQIDVFKEFLLVPIVEKDNVNINSINDDINSINADSCTQIEIESKLKLKTNNAAVIIDDINDEFLNVVNDWLEYKKSRRESYKNQKSIKAFIAKLKNLSGSDPQIARKIIEESMANNWAGIFELKTSINGAHSKNFSKSDRTKQLAYEAAEDLARRMAENQAGNR